MTQLNDLGMNALPLRKISKVRYRLENEWESVVIWSNRVSIHVGVYRYRVVRTLGVRKSSDKGVANESLELGVEKMGRI